jgi:hypothetical protein
MPIYFFHLTFGGRVIHDDEGFTLPNRSAAREEALGVVRDLRDPETGRPSRDWAGWFLQVADDRGDFFRTPLGHPALELVSNQPIPQAQPEKSEVRKSRASGRGVPTSMGPSQAAKLLRDCLARRQRTAQLARRTQSSRRRAKSLCSVTKILQTRSRELVAQARLVLKPSVR